MSKPALSAKAEVSRTSCIRVHVAYMQPFVGTLVQNYNLAVTSHAPQVRLPNLLLPRCLYILASAALYIRLGVAASTAHAVAVVGMYNMVGILICALLDFKNRCAWATVHGVPGMPAAVRPATSTATTRQ